MTSTQPLQLKDSPDGLELAPDSEVWIDAGTLPWEREPGFLLSFEIDSKGVQDFLSNALYKRFSNLTVFAYCLTGPYVIFPLVVPCVISPCAECFLQHPKFKKRLTQRQVALTTRGIVIRVPTDALQPSESWEEDNPKLNCHPLDQFNMDVNFDESTDGPYSVRRLYFDEIRSANIVPNPTYKTSCCLAVCFGSEVASPVSYVQIDIGKGNETKRGKVTNPVLVGLKDPQRFCKEVNKCANGVKLGEIALQVAPAATSMERNDGASLSTELSRLAELHDKGYLKGEEYSAAKMAIIKKFNTK
jgi:hypothetical protein